MSTLEAETKAWLGQTGFTVADEDLWLAALTHGSMDEAHDYERLEFLGDRVLGLSIASWLFERDLGPEGTLSRQLNALVSRDSCAVVARRIGLPEHIRISKQARNDGGADSSNILGDVMESLLGAQFLQDGFERSNRLIRKLWLPMIESGAGQEKHPKSALQEWAAGNQRKPPFYEVTDRSGPDHAAKFTVRVSVHKVGEAEGTASSKQEAETAAAKAFMEQFA
ncbi:ribonuclease III [Altererythrobacter sp. MF3-039]|uniref:ribonuclease III n=1 Tax=Altererythrobacter sp. MF3-039 TaxID=3252901 RepID=UPI00390CC82B